jgi:predicted MFS family arabinose efflux permease
VNTAAASLALPARLLTIVFAPFAAGFFLSFLLRNANAVISKDLVAEFSLSSTELGLLTSAYFLAFAAMQIPLGVFLDRYGPRRVTAGLLLIAAAGVGLFTFAGGLGSLALGRALIGMGVSACLMGSMKAYAMWFPLDRLATLNGWTLAAGALGAVAATAPLEYAASVFGWRPMFGLLAMLTLLASTGIFFLVPEKPVPGASERWDEQIPRIIAIFSVPAFWRIGLPMIILQGVYQGLFGLWLIPWLIDTQGLTRGTAAQWLMWAAVTYALASIFFGQGADALARRGIPRIALLKWGAGLGVAAYFALMFVPGSPKLVLLLAYAVGVVAPILCYAILPPHFPRRSPAGSTRR